MHSTPIRCTFWAAALLLAMPAAAEDVSRLQQVTDELATLQTVVDKLPEGRERSKLVERRTLLERERDILRKRQLLEVREAALDHRLQDSPALKLQSMLRALEEPHKQLQQTDLDRLNDQIREAAARNASLKAARDRIARLPPSADRAERLAAIDEQVLTATEESESLQLQREATNHWLALAREVETVKARQGAETAMPPLQLRSWWEKQRELRTLAGRLESERETARAVDERRAAAADALALAREKLGQIDEEIALLTPEVGIFRSTPGVDRLLGAARRDKAALTSRLPALEAQADALAEAAATTGHLASLLGTESAWLRDRQHALTMRLLRWLAWPVGVLTLVALGFLGANRFVLPRIYRHEMLVSARRANHYFMVATLLAVLAGFFFEDLRLLATTLGIVSAALVIALQDVFASIAGWFAIIISHKVRVGDRVEIDGEKGDVLEIELMRTTLNEVDAGLGVDHPTGRIIAIPNSFIFRSRVHNATRHHRWVWLRTDFTVTYETPLPVAIAVIRKAVEDVSAEAFAEARRDAVAFEVRFGRPDAVYEPKIYCTIADSGVMFTVLVVAEYNGKSAMRDRLHWRILNDFARDPRLQFAYPTHRGIYTRDPFDRPPTETLSGSAAPFVVTSAPGRS